VRADADRGSLGNQVASIWASLPVHEPDAVKRLGLLSERMQGLKSSGQAVGAQLLTTLGEYAPPTIIAQASRLVARQRAFNLVVTNVPGPQIPLYTLGRRMQEVYPVLPLSANTTLGVALLSYDGTIGFGLLGDYDAAPDLALLAEGIEKSLSQLLGALPDEDFGGADGPTARSSAGDRAPIGGAPSTAPAKSTRKKSTAKKSTAKKSAAKKTTAKRTGGRKKTTRKKTARKKTAAGSKSASAAGTSATAQKGSGS
jgi:hypothetical protein